MSDRVKVYLVNDDDGVFIGELKSTGERGVTLQNTLLRVYTTPTEYKDTPYGKVMIPWHRVELIKWQQS